MLLIGTGRLQRWQKDRTMSFVPPDGHFTLAEYRYSGSSSQNSALGTSVASTKELIPIPFGIKASFEFDANTGKHRLANLLSKS
jgi:AP-3 complex subunit mu